MRLNKIDITAHKVAYRDALVQMSRISDWRAEMAGDVDPAAMDSLDNESYRLNNLCQSIVRIMTTEVLDAQTGTRKS